MPAAYPAERSIAARRRMDISFLATLTAAFLGMQDPESVRLEVGVPVTRRITTSDEAPPYGLARFYLFDNIAHLDLPVSVV